MASWCLKEKSNITSKYQKLTNLAVARNKK
jgi:hypothetical protein